MIFFLGPCFFLLVTVCSGHKSSDTGGSKGASGASQSPAPPWSVVPGVQPEKLGSPRLLRRISLDLTGRLPVASEREAVAADPDEINSVAEAMIASAEGARSIAEMHRVFWRLNGRVFNDFDHFYGQGDTSLSDSVLTSVVRNQIVGEPINYIRRVISDGGAYGSIFSGSGTIASSKVLSLWDMSKGAEVWSGEGLYAGTYKISRPEVGVLGVLGFWASWPSASQSLPLSRAAAMLSRMACVNLEVPSAHDFSSLTVEELGGDLKALALTKASCAGCHGPIASMAPALAGVARSDKTFAEWKAYEGATANAANTAKGQYAGKSFTGFAGLAAGMAEDRRIVNCSMRGALSLLLQRPYQGQIDGVKLTSMIEEFDKADESIAAAMIKLIQSDEYEWKPMSSNVSAEVTQRASGVRFLGRRQLLGVLPQFGASAALIALSENLEPGSEEAAGTTFRQPSGLYWHELMKVARQAAVAVVTDELADGVAVDSRKMLTALPLGSGVGADAAAIAAQVKATWELITSQTLQDDSPKLAKLLAVFAAGAGAEVPTTDDASRLGWRSVLTAMFLSPEFVLY